MGQADLDAVVTVQLSTAISSFLDGINIGPRMRRHERRPPALRGAINKIFKIKPT